MDLSKNNNTLWLLPDSVVKGYLRSLASEWRKFHNLSEISNEGHEMLHALHLENPDKIGEGHIDVAEAALCGREFNPLATFLQEEGSEWEDSLRAVYDSTLRLHPVVKRVIKKSGLITK
jgi:hypothetical protein